MSQISRAICWIHTATTPRGISCSWRRSRYCRLPFALALLCILSLTFLLSKSVPTVKVDIISKSNSKGMMMMRTMSSKFVLGSRPPRCVNRCMNCWPCNAVLVIPPQRKQSSRSSSTSVRSISAQQDDEGYYLLSWKCRCKNKLFQP